MANSISWSSSAWKYFCRWKNKQTSRSEFTTLLCVFGYFVFNKNRYNLTNFTLQFSFVFGYTIVMLPISQFHFHLIFSAIIGFSWQIFSLNFCYFLYQISYFLNHIYAQTDNNNNNNINIIDWMMKWRNICCHCLMTKTKWYLLVISIWKPKYFESRMYSSVYTEFLYR